MKITVKASDPLKLSVDLIAFLYFKDSLNDEINKFPAASSAEIRQIIKKENFKGTKTELITFSAKGQIAAYKIIFKGLGVKKDFTPAKLAEETAKIVQAAIQNKSVNAGIVITDEILKLSDSAKIIQTVAEVIDLASYSFKKYKSRDEKDEQRELEEFFISIKPPSIKIAEEAIALAKIMSGATNYTRDLVNEPAQITTPGFLPERP